MIKQLTPPGYAYGGESRQGTRTGGGVGLVYESTYELVKSITSSQFDTFEHMEVTFTSVSLKIVIIYYPRSPSIHSFSQKLHHTL